VPGTECSLVLLNSAGNPRSPQRLNCESEQPLNESPMPSQNTTPATRLRSLFNTKSPILLIVGTTITLWRIFMRRSPPDGMLALPLGMPRPRPIAHHQCPVSGSNNSIRAGNLGGKDAHVGEATIGIAPAWDLAADAAHRDAPMAKPYAEKCLKFDVFQRRLLVCREAPDLSLRELSSIASLRYYRRVA